MRRLKPRFIDAVDEDVDDADRPCRDDGIDDADNIRPPMTPMTPKST
jgi:hypothetical protein